MKLFAAFIISAAFSICNSTATAQGERGISDKKKNFKTDCTPCRDAWVTQAYYEVWGACPSASGGESDNCNIRLYNNGSWSSYGDLYNKVRALYTARVSYGKVYVFMRPTDALGFGHMGWGIQLSDGSYYCGATENPFNVNKPAETLGILPGGEIHSWSMRVRTEQQMFERMKSMRYTKWKGVAVKNPNIANAKNLIDNIKNRGYDGINNNCMDHSYDVFTYYGLGWGSLPLKQTFPVPNEWFRRFYADNSNNYAEGWNL